MAPAAPEVPLPESHWRTRRQPLRPLLAPQPTLREPNSRSCMMRGLHADSAQTCRGGNGCPHWQLPYDVRPPLLGDPGGRSPGASFRPFPSVERGPPEALQRKVRSVAPPPAAKAPPAPFPLSLRLRPAALGSQSGNGERMTGSTGFSGRSPGLCKKRKACAFLFFVHRPPVIFSCLTLWSITWREASSFVTASTGMPSSTISTRAWYARSASS